MRLVESSLAALIVLQPAMSSPSAQGEPWYKAITRPGANLHSIVAAHRAQKAAKRSARKRDPMAFLRMNLAEMEEESDTKFERWRNYVEPRVYPTGDLALLERTEREIASVALRRSGAAARGAWEPLGPFSSGTMGAGRLNWMEFHPKQDSAFMVGSPGGGLWFTRDGGRSWSTTTDHLAVLGAAWAVYHPTNPDVIYLGTGDGFGWTQFTSIGVLKSTDGGNTWKPTGLTYPASRNIRIMKLVVDPDNPEKLIVATSENVHVSMDGGATFVVSTGIGGHVWDLERHPTDDRIVYASTTSFFRSLDGGLTFSEVAGAKAGHRMIIAVTPAEPDWVYVLRGTENSTEGVDRSTDRGARFTPRGAATEVGCQQAYYDYAFAANPLDAQDLAAGCIEIFRSSNGGGSWTLARTEQGSGAYHVDIQGLFFRKDGTLYATTDGGLYRNDGPNDWTDLNANLNIGQLYRLGADPLDYDRVCSGRQDNGVDFRDGDGFKLAATGDGFGCFWNRAKTLFYLAVQNELMLRCGYDDRSIGGCDGLTIGSEADPPTFQTNLVQDVLDDKTLYGSRQNNLWKSGDGGWTWSQMGTLGGTPPVLDFAVSPSDSRTIYAIKGAGIFSTTDEGRNWVEVRSGPLSTNYPGSIQASASNPKEVWFTMVGSLDTSKVWRSLDGGRTWSNETGTGLPNLSCEAIALDETNGSVYVGMDVGVYYRKIGEKTWKLFAGGLPNASIRDLRIVQKGTDPRDRRLLAATFGRGMWRTRLWEDVAVRVRPAPPVLRGFSASVRGGALHLAFGTGTDRIPGGEHSFELRTTDGTLLHRESIPGLGAFEKTFPLGRFARGIGVFILKGPGGRVSRPVAIF